MFPFRSFGREDVRAEGGQCDNRRRDANKDIVADFKLPERFDAQVLRRAAPACEAHAAIRAREADLAEFVVADDGAEPARELSAKLLQAFARAFEGGVIADADVKGIAGVIAVGDNVVEGLAVFEEAVKEKEPEEADSDLGGDDIDPDLENVDEGEDSPDNDIDLGGDDDLGEIGTGGDEDEDH